MAIAYAWIYKLSDDGAWKATVELKLPKYVHGWYPDIDIAIIRSDHIVLGDESRSQVLIWYYEGVKEFARVGWTDWNIRKQTLRINDASRFGASMDAVGNCLVVGAPTYDSGRGAVFIYERKGIDFQYYQIQTISTPSTSDTYFGRTVSIFLNYQYLVIGGAHLGVYLYKFDSINKKWDEVQTLYGKKDYVSISDNYLVTGNSGNISIWERNDNDNWIFKRYIKGTDISSSNEKFGRPIAMSADGGTMAIGNSPNCVYIYDALQ